MKNQTRIFLYAIPVAIVIGLLLFRRKPERFQEDDIKSIKKGLDQLNQQLCRLVTSFEYSVLPTTQEDIDEEKRVNKAISENCKFI